MEYTKQQFNALQAIYAYFNKVLFDGKLNDCLLNFSRKSKAYGFFAPKRWGGINEKSATIHEISLNPEHLKRKPKEVLSTLVHEMVHLWQQDFGKPSPGYHNKEWAQKMKEIGLFPSSTSAVGGKEIGKNCSHYVIAGGAYDKAFEAMPETLFYPFVCVAEVGTETTKKEVKNKTKYTCPFCKTNIWGKSGLKVECSECEAAFVEQKEK